MNLRNILTVMMLAGAAALSGCGEDTPSSPTTPTLELLWPVGGETLSGVAHVRWRVENGSDEVVSVLLSSTSGTGYAVTLDHDAPAGETFAWDTTSVPDGSSYRIRVDLVGSSKVRLDSDASAADFTVDNGS